jgi:hypothetical protein
MLVAEHTIGEAWAKGAFRTCCEIRLGNSPILPSSARRRPRVLIFLIPTVRRPRSFSTRLVIYRLAVKLIVIEDLNIIVPPSADVFYIRMNTDAAQRTRHQHRKHAQKSHFLWLRKSMSDMERLTIERRRRVQEKSCW